MANIAYTDIIVLSETWGPAEIGFTRNNTNITSSHVLLNDVFENAVDDIQWTTTDGSVSISGVNIYPFPVGTVVKFYLGVPVN